MDAFFHAAEAYLATIHQPASDHLALEAISLVTRYLPLAVKNGRDLEARSHLAWANTEAGICESLSSCISHHSLEHAISAYYPEVAHGAGLTLLSVEYFRTLAERAPERFPDLARAMGEDPEAVPESERPFVFVKALEKLIRSIGLGEESLSTYGVEKSELDAMAENAFFAMGGLFDLTPAVFTKEDVVAVFEKAY